MGFRVGEGSADGRERRNGTTADLIALDSAKRQAKRECGVRIDGRPVDVEQGPGDQGIVGPFDSLDLVFMDLADGPRLGVDGDCQLDRGVGGRLNGRETSLGQLVAGSSRRRVSNPAPAPWRPRQASDLAVLVLDERIALHALFPVGQ